jgi:hypothetical protein
MRVIFRKRLGWRITNVGALWNQSTIFVCVFGWLSPRGPSCDETNRQIDKTTFSQQCWKFPVFGCRGVIGEEQFRFLHERNELSSDGNFDFLSWTAVASYPQVQKQVRRFCIFQLQKSEKISIEKLSCMPDGNFHIFNHNGKWTFG